MLVIKERLSNDPNKKNLIDGGGETQVELKHPLIRKKLDERQGSRERSRLTKISGAKGSVLPQVINGIGDDVQNLLKVRNHRRALWTPVPRSWWWSIVTCT